MDISVIVPSYKARATIEACLDSLHAQKTAASYEIIVVGSGDDEAAGLADRFPEVRLLWFRERKFAGHARNLGALEARGAILAFVDADCIPAEDWIEAIRHAHQDTAPVIGGVVANANPESIVGRAYYFAEFNRWLPDSPPGRVDEVPGCCWSMKRPAFERYGPFLEGTYCSDTAFQWRMAVGGERSYLILRSPSRTSTRRAGTTASRTSRSTAAASRGCGWLRRACPAGWPSLAP